MLEEIEISKKLKEDANALMKEKDRLALLVTGFET